MLLEHVVFRPARSRVLHVGPQLHKGRGDVDEAGAATAVALLEQTPELAGKYVALYEGVAEVGHAHGAPQLGAAGQGRVEMRHAVAGGVAIVLNTGHARRAGVAPGRHGSRRSLRQNRRGGRLVRAQVGHKVNVFYFVAPTVCAGTKPSSQRAASTTHRNRQGRRMSLFISLFYPAPRSATSHRGRTGILNHIIFNRQSYIFFIKSYNYKLDFNARGHAPPTERAGETAAARWIT